MTLGQIVLERRVAVFVVFSAVTVLGLVALMIIPVDLLPGLRVPWFVIRCPAPGIPAEVLEKTVTIPVEAALQGIDGLKRTTTVTREGVAVISAEFDWSSDPEAILLEARERMERIAPLLPPGRRPSIIMVDPLDEPVMSVAVSPAGRTPGGDEAVLSGLSELAGGVLRRRLELIEGVGTVRLVGVRGRELLIEADPGKLVAAGLVPDDVALTLNQCAVWEDVGGIQPDGTAPPAILASELGGLRTIRGLEVHSRTGGPAVRLGDVAGVTWSATIPAGRVRVDGREVIELQITKTPSANALVVARTVHREIQCLRADFPDVDFRIIGDESVFIQRTVEDVIDAGLTGGMLSFAILFLVLRTWRDPIVVGVSYPISILATILVMQLIGLHLNIVSLAGLALGIGMLGDNAVIVVENVRKHVERGSPLRQAVLDGAAGITIPAAVSTLTNVAVFLPVLMLDGVGRQLFGPMAVSMTVSLLVSLLVATTLVPGLWDPGNHFPRPAMHRRPEETRGKAILHRYLIWSIRRKWAVAGTAMTAMVLSAALATTLSRGEIPSTDDTALFLVLEFPPGTPDHDLLRHLDPLEEALLHDPSIAGITTRIGLVDETDLWSAGASSATRVVVTITLRAGSVRQEAAERIGLSVGMLARQIVGLHSSLGPRPTAFDRLLTPGGQVLCVRVGGVTEHEWRRHSDEILSAVASVRGVSEVRGPRDSPVDEFRSEADPDACARAGLADAQVASWVMPSFPGGLTLTLRDVHGPLPIRLVVANSAADPDRRVIPHGRVSTARGPMDLRLLITGRWHRRAAALCREDGRRVYLVTVDDGHGATGGLQEDLVSSLRRVPLPPGASIRVGLLSREATDSAASVWAAIALSLVLMFMILAAEYGSVVLALIVLVTSPLAFIGAVAALAIAGEPLGVLSLAGVVVTVGAVDNDAVIAIDVIAAKLGHGAQLAEAIVDGMVLRFRPMVITSLTTVLGMAPLLWQSGSGSVMVRSLAIPLTGGLIASTIATVLVIPSVIAIVGHRAILRPDLGRGCAIGG